MFSPYPPTVFGGVVPAALYTWKALLLVYGACLFALEVCFCACFCLYLCLTASFSLWYKRGSEALLRGHLTSGVPSVLGGPCGDRHTRWEGGAGVCSQSLPSHTEVGAPEFPRSWAHCVGTGTLREGVL